MTSKKLKKPTIRLRSVAPSDLFTRKQIASEIMSGLIASRGQYPLEGLQEKAKELALTAAILTDALLDELGKGH